MTIAEYHKNAKAINLQQLAADIIEEHRDEIVMLNQRQLYTKSETQKGAKLDPYRSTVYAEYKYAMNPLAGLGRPDLSLTGDFYKAFYVKVTKTTFEVDSRDKKAGHLKEKYGDEIFGLSDDSLAELTKDYIEVALLTRIKQLL